MVADGQRRSRLGGPKLSITYGPYGNRAKVPIGPAASLEGESESSINCEGDENEGDVTWSDMFSLARWGPP